jgi:glutamate dehydrogenase/leucine dehydrogenase
VLGGLPDPAAAIAAGWFTLISDALSASTHQTGSPDQPATRHSPLATLHNCRISLQGFGPAAAALARLLQEAGARLVAVADKSGGLFADRGLDLTAICNHVAKQGMIYGCDAAEPVRNSDVLESACDLLITAATERQLNVQNAARVRAPLILEAVHGAVTPAAGRILSLRGMTVIPDLLGAASRTLAWFAEWQHALHCSVPEQAEIESAIRRQLGASWRRVRSLALAREADLAEACRLLALEKLGANLRLRE